MKIYPPYYTLPQPPAGNHVRFSQPPSTVFGEAPGAALRAASDDDVLETGSVSDSGESVDSLDSFPDISDAGAPSPFDTLPFPRAPTPPPVDASISWASRLVGVFDTWVERLEQVVVVLRITITGYADELIGKVTDTHGKLVGAVDAISSAITMSLENVRYRVHGFLGRKI
jgi:hypothetical protein